MERMSPRFKLPAASILWKDDSQGAFPLPFSPIPFQFEVSSLDYYYLPYNLSYEIEWIRACAILFFLISFCVGFFSNIFDPRFFRFLFCGSARWLSRDEQARPRPVRHCEAGRARQDGRACRAQNHQQSRLNRDRAVSLLFILSLFSLLPMVSCLFFFSLSPLFLFLHCSFHYISLIFSLRRFTFVNDSHLLGCPWSVRRRWWAFWIIATSSELSPSLKTASTYPFLGLPLIIRIF